MAQTIGEYLYRIAWQVDKSGAAALKKEGDAAQKSVDGLGRSLDKTEQEAKDLSAAADKTSREIRDVGNASREAGGQVDQLDKLTQGVTSTLKRFFGVAAMIATVRRTFSAILSTATQMDALANSAAAVGASAAGMARLAYATDLAGVSAAEMETALKGVRQSAAQAAAGIGAGVKAWKLIGVSTRDENGNLKDTTRLIDELGAKFAQMDEGRAQALGKLVKMTPQVITALRTGMMEYGKEFDQMLGSMTPSFDEAVKAAQRLHSAQSRLSRVMGLLWQGIASRFFEPFAKAFDTIRQAVITNQAALVRFASAVLQPLALALSGLAEAFGTVSNALGVLVSGFDALGPAAQTAVQALLWGSAAYLLLLKKITLAQITAAMTNPFVWIAAAITGVLLLLDDFAVAMRGGQCYFDWTLVVEFAKKVRDFGGDIVKWFKDLPGRIAEAFTGFSDKLKAMWTDVINWLSAKWDAFIKTITGWMPDELKRTLGIKVEGEAETPEQARTRAIDIEYSRRLAEDPNQGVGWGPADYKKLRDTIAAEYDAAHPAPPAPVQAAQVSSPTEIVQPGAEQSRPVIEVIGQAPELKVPDIPAPAVSVAAEAPTIAMPQMPEMPAPVVNVAGTQPAAAETPTPAINNITVEVPEIKVPEIQLPEAAAAPAAPAPSVPTPAQFAAALGAAAPKGDAQHQPMPAAQPVARVVKAAEAITAGGQTLDRAQPLGTNVTNNIDAHKNYDIPVNVSNSTTVNITATTAEPVAIGDQVERAVDTSNAQLVRNLQTPLAAIADDSGNTMSTE